MGIFSTERHTVSDTNTFIYRRTIRQFTFHLKKRHNGKEKYPKFLYIYTSVVPLLHFPPEIVILLALEMECKIRLIFTWITCDFIKYLVCNLNHFCSSYFTTDSDRTFVKNLNYFQQYLSKLLHNWNQNKSLNPEAWEHFSDTVLKYANKGNF